MASRPILAATLQAALLAAMSNVLAQLITASRNKTELLVDWIPVFQFLLFSIVNTPPNFLWQDFLESTFPAHPPAPHPKKFDDKPLPQQPLSLRNTLAKFLLDQTLGAAANTLLFSVSLRALQDAMAPAPRITGFHRAWAYWSGPRAIDFARVDFAAVWDAARAEFWPLVGAGARFWPVVSIVNFTLVKTVEGRNLVGAVAGVAWGVYMSMVAAQ
ncbi:Mpv17/PMP22 family protein [Tolypocladium paradoxum]|uniref:Mpv17/PMP22 family protein n=1 Tax=Tolypocladium paradoxum TaxID=94208 RepID=A0A2S4KST9_9HYPO|nr:Mpv17/PMP22 family protein [Tolypocladium paradoxum]